MDTTTKQAIETVVLGESQSGGGLTFFPLTRDGDLGPNYLTLKEAFAKELITVKEVSQGGSVPELFLKNDGEIPILILDGEELVGAKQNRVVNTTMLIPPKMSIPIPVSCTEQGRWSYSSDQFMDSDVVMPREARRGKLRSVSSSYQRVNSPVSDQGEVWDEVSFLQNKLGTQSRTQAMKDSYHNHKNRLKDWREMFTLQPGQCGFIAFAGDRPLGMDLISRPSSYVHLHDRLVRSYLIDMIEDFKEGDWAASVEQARKFLARLTDTAESSYPSVGYGTDFRYEGKEVCGTALVYEETAVHAAFITDASSSSREQSPSSAHLRDRIQRVRRRGRDNQENVN